MHVKTPLGIEVVGAGERRRATYAKACALVMARPKREYVRSETILAAVRACKWCAGCSGPGPVQPAHSNWQIHGKAGAKKADDNRIAALCPTCHRELDQGSRWSEDERKQFWWRAHRITVLWLIEEGRWPKWVPVPEIGTNPFAALAASPGD